MLTATSVSSVSADPPLLMFSLFAHSSDTPTIRRPGARAWIRGRVLTSMDAGGSAIVLVEAIEASPMDAADERVPLVYHNRTWCELGDHSQIA